MSGDRPLKIVLTGGPGGGKTTAADMIARELPGRVVVLKETATLLFSGGFPRSGGPAAQRAVQRAIYRVESTAEAARLDVALRAVWAPHPRMRHVRHDGSFLCKVIAALDAFNEIIEELGGWKRGEGCASGDRTASTAARTAMA